MKLVTLGCWSPVLVCVFMASQPLVNLPGSPLPKEAPRRNMGLKTPALLRETPMVFIKALIIRDPGAISGVGGRGAKHNAGETNHDFWSTKNGCFFYQNWNLVKKAGAFVPVPFVFKRLRKAIDLACKRSESVYYVPFTQGSRHHHQWGCKLRKWKKP